MQFVEEIASPKVFTAKAAQWVWFGGRPSRAARMSPAVKHRQRSIGCPVIISVSIEPAAIVGGVFTCGLWCFLMIWTDRHFLPKPLRMGRFLVITNIVAGTVLTGIGIKAILDYVLSLLAKIG